MPNENKGLPKHWLFKMKSFFIFYHPFLMTQYSNFMCLYLVNSKNVNCSAKINFISF